MKHKDVICRVPWYKPTNVLGSMHVLCNPQTGNIPETDAHVSRNQVHAESAHHQSQSSNIIKYVEEMAYFQRVLH
jgi:hypothetical protein